MAICMSGASPATPSRLQEAAPRWAHFCLSVDRFLRRELGVDPDGKMLVVGLSGGLDSTVLLHVLTLLAKKKRGRVIAAHFDHRLRPDSGQDADAARSFCETLGVDCVSGSGDVFEHAQSRGVGLEEAGRELRHGFLRSVADTTGADFICLAHQLDDLAEDQLMRLTRGTGWPELGGMAAFDPDRRLLRPLLLTPRRVLARYAAENGLAWREDPSNSDRAFRRNRVRQDLLPVLVRENPAYLRAAAALWRLARVDGIFWRGQLESVEEVRDQEHHGEIVIPLNTLRGLPPALRLRALKRALVRLGRGQALSSTLLALDEAVTDERPGGPREFAFQGGARVAVNAGVARFFVTPASGVDSPSRRG